MPVVSFGKSLVCIVLKHDLSYRFPKDHTVLTRINLQVPAGSIFGFLGPNGAEACVTTLRLLLGLLKKQEGSISIFGKELAKNRIDILSKTGSLIESLPCMGIFQQQRT